MDAGTLSLDEDSTAHAGAGDQVRRKHVLLNELQSVPPLYSAVLSSVHPLARLLFLAVPLLVTALPVDVPVLLLLAGALAAIYFAVFSPAWIAFALLAPILVLSCVVGLAMVFIGDQPGQDVIRYVLTLVIANLAGYIVVFSSKLLELAALVDWLLLPLRWAGHLARTLVVAIIVAARFFVVLIGSLGAIRKAFQARNIRLRGLRAMRMMAAALLLKVIRAVDDVAVALISRGTVLERRSALIYEPYSIIHTAAFLLGVALVVAVLMACRTS
jgi:energy-coupling factor transporter transmembrane protein EcfT